MSTVAEAGRSEESEHIPREWLPSRSGFHVVSPDAQPVVGVKVGMWWCGIGVS